MTFKQPIRYSGYRISLLPESQQKEMWTHRLQDIQWLIPTLEAALSETYFCDDSIVDMPFDQMVKAALMCGELFGCVHEVDGANQVVGFVLLRDVRPGRDAWMEGYVVPEFRGKYPVAKQIREVLSYAFRPWNPEQTRSQQLSPKGLGLRKLKASLSGSNLPAARFLASLGFFSTGVSMMDGLFKGNVTDIIQVEKFNPLYLPKPEPINVRKPQPENSNPSVVHAPAGIPSSAAVPAATYRKSSPPTQ